MSLTTLPAKTRPAAAEGGRAAVAPAVFSAAAHATTTAAPRVPAQRAPAPTPAPSPAPSPSPAPARVVATAPLAAVPTAHPRSQPTSTRSGPRAEAVARTLTAQLAVGARYGLLAGQAGDAVPDQVHATLRDLIEVAFPHLRAGTPDWLPAVVLAATQAADVLGRYAVPLTAVPSTSTPGAREGVAALSRGIDALLVEAGVSVVLDLDAGTAAFTVQSPAGSAPARGRAALLATCVVLLHLRLTQPLVLAALVTEGGTWLPVWRAARDLWTVSD